VLPVPRILANADGIMIVVNDGNMGCVYKLDERGLVDLSVDPVNIDHLFGVKQGRMSAQAQYVDISQLGTVVFSIERADGLLAFPRMAFDEAPLPLPTFDKECKSVAIAADGQLMCGVSRNCAIVTKLTRPDPGLADSCEEGGLASQLIGDLNHVNGVAFSNNRLFLSDSMCIRE
jgi:hypothetical protein